MEYSKSINFNEGFPGYFEVPKGTPGALQGTDGRYYVTVENAFQHPELFDTPPTLVNVPGFVVEPIAVDVLHKHKLEIEGAVDDLVENTLREYWYKSIGEVAATVLNNDSMWQSEAVALNVWQGSVYEALHSYLESVTAETMQPVADFIETLPKFTI